MNRVSYNIVYEEKVDYRHYILHCITDMYTYIYICIRNYFAIMNFQVEELLELPAGSLKDIRVGRAEVTFKVVQNDKNYNASDVANSIGTIISVFCFPEYEF